MNMYFYQSLCTKSAFLLCICLFIFQSWPLNSFSFYFIPVTESESKSNTPFLTVHPLSILANKAKPLKQVPWMVGVTEDEGCSMYSGLVLKRPELTQTLESTWDELICHALHLDKFVTSSDEELSLARKIRKFYFGNEPVSLGTRDNLTNLYSDTLYTYGVFRSAMETASRKENIPVYLYQYAYPGPISLFGLFYELTEEEAKS